MEVWRDGQPLSVRDVPPKLTIEPLPRTPHFLFWWFNGDADRHHLADLWVWYAAVAGFGRDRTVAWIASFGAFAALLSVAGLWLFARTLPAGALGWRRPRRRARQPAPGRARSLLSTYLRARRLP